MQRPPYRDVPESPEAPEPVVERRSMATDWVVVGVILATIAYLTDWPRLVNATARVMLGF